MRYVFERRTNREARGAVRDAWAYLAGAVRFVHRATIVDDTKRGHGRKVEEGVMQSRRDMLRSACAFGAALVAAPIVGAVAVDTRIALHPVTYVTALLCREHPDLRGVFRMPRDDSAYVDFDSRYREMTDAEESAWRQQATN